MDSQKVVVVLLLVTIILSVISVVLTLTVSVPQSGPSKLSVNANQISNAGDLKSVQNGQISLGIEAPKK
ncbi:MAG: hypothetical protein AABW51_04230 [Nanoarchaeota archaeon]